MFIYAQLIKTKLRKKLSSWNSDLAVQQCSKQQIKIIILPNL